MKDFVFGTLATEELRRKYVRACRAGVSHAYQRSPLDPLPGEEITIKLSIGPDYPCEKAWLYWTKDHSDPKGRMGIASNGFAIPMEDCGAEWDTQLWGYIRHFRVVIPGQASDVIVRYCLTGITPSGIEIPADNGAIYAIYIANDPPPAWSRDAIVYQIFVDRFFPGDNGKWLSPEHPSGFYGGTLRGITEKLDYLNQLGVNVLWLTPIFPSPSHHGYDATDLYEIEPRLGTKADLLQLLESSHQIGIRVLLDLVPNHISNLHPAFKSAVTDFKSTTRNWFTFSHWPDQYSSFFDVPELPQLNLSHPDARKYVLDAAAYWLELGVDGYRVDYALGPVPDFWADFRQVTRRVRPDCWTFGEVVEPPDAQIKFAGGLDGCLDFNLMEAFRISFAYGEWNAERFMSFLSRHEGFFPEDFSRPSFLDNHDMNRYLWAAYGDFRRLRLAALCQFTLSAPPVIYYGTEVGLSQERDVRQGGYGLPEESRLPMLWGSSQVNELLVYYQNLIKLRKKYSELRRGKAHEYSTTKNCLLYTRGENDDFLVVANLSGDQIKIDIQENYGNVMIESTPGAVILEKMSLTISSFSGAVLSKSS